MFQAIIFLITQFWFLGLILIIVLLLAFFKPVIKGFFGEKSISALLSFLPKENYKVINNVLLKSNNRTAQIDHIVVSNYGIFVIETKNYKGWIFGSEKDEYWVQNIYGKKNRFKNPIRQNYGHVLALQELLNEFSCINFYPIVAFSPECDLKINTSSKVVYFSQINTVIKNHFEINMTKEMVEMICNKIILANVDSKENRNIHINSIRQKIVVNETAINNDICPKCYGKLVQRNGKYGKFKGCSNYPKCKFTLKY